MIHQSSSVQIVDTTDAKGEVDLSGHALVDLLIERVGETYAGRLALDFDESGGLVWENLSDKMSIRVPIPAGSMEAGEMLSILAHSTVATGDVIGVGLRASSDVQPVPGYDAAMFRVDWTGHRRISIAFEDFERLLPDPSIFLSAGTNPLPATTSIDEIVFFAGLYGQTPSPRTRLVIVGCGIESGASPMPLVPSPTRPLVEGVEFQSRGPLARDFPVGHEEPEVVGSATLPSDYTYKAYGRGERVSHGYYPAYVPGPVSIGPDGTRYVLGAGHLLQWRELGEWQSVDLLAKIAPTIVGQSESKALIDGAYFSTEAAIRFDADGDVYVLMYVAGENNGLPRRSFLLHSPDLATWTVYVDAFLDGIGARFEKHSGQNSDCLLNPPVIVNSASPPSMMLPTKSGGTLNLSKQVSLVETDIASFLFHSGEGGSIVSIGDDVFITYGRLNRPGASGVEVYVTRYDRSGDTLSTPVLVCEGGVDPADAHNYPVITCDQNDTLHLIANGHHDPFYYASSTSPADETSWSVPTAHSDGTSYLGLVCDSVGTLYSVSRESNDGYIMRLTLHKKTSDGAWTQSRIVSPEKSFYRVWYQKLVIDPTTDDLYLFYHSHSLQYQIYDDELRAMAFRRPDVYWWNKSESLPIGTSYSTPRTYSTIQSAVFDPVVLVSRDSGSTWSLALSEDFD